MMKVVDKKRKLKEIINECKGFKTINEFLDTCSIEPMRFNKVLDTRNEYFILDKITIQKIITNASRTVDRSKLENDLLSLIEIKDRSIDIRRGQIYWVNFGEDSIGSEQRNIRPALVIQNNMGNINSPVIVVVAITSKLKATHLPVHVLVDDLELQSCGLNESSMILTEQVRTIDKGRVVSYSGECPFGLMKRIENAVKIEFDIYNPVKIHEFVDQFAEKFNLKDNFKLALASEMKKYFEVNNVDFENVDEYISNIKFNSLRQKNKVYDNNIQQMACAI